MQEEPSSAERIVNLELSVMQLQQDLDKISEVVLEQQKQIEGQQRQIATWEEKLTAGQEDLPDPFDEKPPHY